MRRGKILQQITRILMLANFTARESDLFSILLKANIESNTALSMPLPPLVSMAEVVILAVVSAFFIQLVGRKLR